MYYVVVRAHGPVLMSKHATEADAEREAKFRKKSYPQYTCFVVKEKKSFRFPKIGGEWMINNSKLKSLT